MCNFAATNNRKLKKYHFQSRTKTIFLTYPYNKPRRTGRAYCYIQDVTPKVVAMAVRDENLKSQISVSENAISPIVCEKIVYIYLLYIYYI